MMTTRYSLVYILWSLFLFITMNPFQGCSSRNSRSNSVAPSVPVNLAAVESSNQVGLSWSASTDNISVAGYKIYRDGQYLESVGTIAALDSGLTGSVQHCYTVSAYNPSGNESAQSAPMCTSSTSTIINGTCFVYPASATGLSGEVLRGPITPVCSVTEPCEAPFSAGFQLEKDGVSVAAFHSNSDGCFAVQVPPGNYVVVPDPDTQALFLHPQTAAVTVGPISWTQVVLTFDTGIR